MSVGNNQVFMLFFAIAWGIVANVQGRWKAFHWTLFCSLKQARSRTILSFLVLNVLPFFFFGYVLWVLELRGHTCSSNPLIAITELVLQSMFPALANFGFYRIWLGIVEGKVDWFYVRDKNQLTPDQRHIEPTAKFNDIVEEEDKNSDAPIVHLGSGTACANIAWGLVYLTVGVAFPWIRLA